MSVTGIERCVLLIIVLGLMISACVPATTTPEGALLMESTPSALEDASATTALATSQASALAEETPVAEAAVDGSAMNATTSAREITIWTIPDGTPNRDTLLDNVDIIREVNPFWYTLAADGTIEGSARDLDFFAELSARGVRVLPTIGNAFARERVHRAIQSPEARAAHVELLLNLVLENDFDGLDVDYESLYAEDKEDFSLFIEALAEAFHAHDKLLSIAVHPKQDATGGWAGAQAQDYPRLGAAVDMFKVMTYDYSWSTSPAGPISPVDWASRVMAYTTSVVPPEKVYLGLHFYGYDWLGETGESKVYDQVRVLMGRYNPEIERDASNEAHFTYGDYRPRTVWFADARTTETKINAIFAAFPNLAGVSIWRLGGEDPANWDVLRTWAQAEQ